MAAISYHSTIGDVQAQPLAASGPFASREWFARLEATQRRPVYAVAEDASGAVVLPLRRAGRRLESLLDRHGFTWRPLATPYGSLDSLLTALAQALAARTSHVVLGRVPDEDGIARQLQRTFERAGWLVQREPCDTNGILHVGGRDFASYLEGRPGPLRTTLKRKAKKVAVDIASSFDPDIWACYAAIDAESREPEEGDSALLRAFAEAEGAAGRLRLAVARHEGEAVAAQVWTVEDGTAYFHAFVHRRHAQPLAPDITLTAAVLERVIDREAVRLVDFGSGDEGFKRDWMDELRLRYRLQCWRKGDPRNWPAIARARLRALVSRRARG